LANICCSYEKHEKTLLVTFLKHPVYRCVDRYHECITQMLT